MSVTKSHPKDGLQAGYHLLWYRINRILGQGAFGITYLAHDINLNRPVAIKEFFPAQYCTRTANAEVKPISSKCTAEFQWAMERFLIEVRTLAQFEHPNIIRVINVFEQNGTAYMVMHYEIGISLAILLKRRRTLGERALLNLTLPILDGLEKVHASGFIHRDIKPANVYIRKSGSPVLLDFGSARQLIQKDAPLTSLVSPGYAPIEQYTSEGKRQGPWTDIYGMGATLYRAVTGLPPPSAVDRSEALSNGRNDEMTPANELVRENYTAAFLAAIDHALAFRVQERPQNIADWRKEFVYDHTEIATQPDIAGATASETRTQDTLPPQSYIETAFMVATLRKQSQGDATNPHGNEEDLVMLNPNWDGGKPELGADFPSMVPSDRPSGPVSHFPKQQRHWLYYGALLSLLVAAAQVRIDHDAPSERNDRPVVVTEPTADVEPAVSPVTESRRSFELTETDGAGMKKTEIPSVTKIESAPPPDPLAVEVESVAGVNPVITQPLPVESSAHSGEAEEKYNIEFDQTILPTDIEFKQLTPSSNNTTEPDSSASDSGESGRAPSTEVMENGRGAVAGIGPETTGSPPPPGAGHEETGLDLNIEARLAAARIDIEARRLTTPQGNNAFEKYQAILQQSPGNQAAREGLEAIVDVYVRIASHAMAEGALSHARSMLERAAVVDSESPKLIEARTTLAQHQSQDRPTSLSDNNTRSSIHVSTDSTATAMEQSKSAFSPTVQAVAQLNNDTDASRTNPVGAVLYAAGDTALLSGNAASASKNTRSQSLTNAVTSLGTSVHSSQQTDDAESLTRQTGSTQKSKVGRGLVGDLLNTADNTEGGLTRTGNFQRDVGSSEKGLGGATDESGLILRGATGSLGGAVDRGNNTLNGASDNLPDKVGSGNGVGNGRGLPAN